LVCFWYKKCLTSLSELPDGRSAAAAAAAAAFVNYFSVMGLRPVVPPGRKYGYVIYVYWSVSWALLGVKVLLACPVTLVLI
ncbi:MAG: hypothetical protein ACKPKO_43800, partial [Candidatus Fonsibacter sp.]